MHDVKLIQKNYKMMYFNILSNSMHLQRFNVVYLEVGNHLFFCFLIKNLTLALGIFVL